jgi:alkylation response protein AidB-like acyl-CoA dehydrogenase
MRKYPVERYFRDARMLGIIVGPTDVQKRIIAKELMKEADKMAELPGDRLLSVTMG